MRLWRFFFPPKCEHDWLFVAGFYDRDLHVHLRLKRCRKCDTPIIHEA